MIECCNENIWYKKKKKRKKQKKIKIILIVLLCVFVYFYYTNLITQNISEICYNRVKSIATESINSSIISISNEKISYDSLIQIEKDNQGKISLIETNSQNVNLLSNSLSLKIQDDLTERLKKGIDIPALAFTGIKLISGFGNEVSFSSVKITNVSNVFENKFESVGINQTRHSVVLNCICKINVILPLKNNEIEIKTPVLLCETIIVGEIPNVYLTK